MKDIFINASDGTVLHARFLRRSSPGPVFVLIHGYGDGGYVWDSSCDALSDLCSTLTLDLRGHGDSGRSEPTRYHVDTHVADIVRVIRTLDLRRVALIGHSLGGLIAAALVETLKFTAVEGVVLVDVCPNPSTDARAAVAYYLRRSLRRYESVDEYSEWLMQCRPLLSAEQARRLAAGALRRCDGGFELKVDPALAEKNSSEAELEIEGRWMRDSLRSIHCPALVVRGTGSAFVSEEAARQMTGVLPNAKSVSVPNAGHSVMSDNPVFFNTLVRDLARRLIRAAVASVQI